LKEYVLPVVIGLLTGGVLTLIVSYFLFKKKHDADVQKLYTEIRKGEVESRKVEIETRKIEIEAEGLEVESVAKVADATIGVIQTLMKEAIDSSATMQKLIKENSVMKRIVEECEEDKEDLRRVVDTNAVLMKRQLAQYQDKLNAMNEDLAEMNRKIDNRV
jgi:hypothetical protein